ncbi:MAG TPA: GerMN domain-containing protein [Acidimicrobiales bacterium]|nr:GerMN domain-containing protein [Acidimicrobiales bacterium]
MGTTTRTGYCATGFRRTGAALGLALVLLTAAACGASGGGSVDAGPTPSRPSTTAVGGADSTVPGSPDTTRPGPSGGGSTSPGSGDTTKVVVYFTRGEKVTAVERSVPRVAGIGAEAVKALVGGPTAAEAADGLGTAIPSETRFRGLAIADGVARVDLSKDFESGGGSLSLSLRLAQVTCTLDQFDSVSGVRFLLDGDLVSVFSGNGILLDQPVGCADYREFNDESPPTSEVFPGIWPFTSQAEMDAYLSGGDRTFTTPAETARQFAIRYVGVRDPAIIGPPTVASGGLVEVKVGFTTGEGGIPIADPRPSMSVFLMAGNADGDQGPWTVVSATSPEIVVESPGDRAQVSSPVAVRGRNNTFEGNVEVQVREDGMLFDESLGSGPVTGGMGELTPFAGEIAFRSPTEAAGAIVFFDRAMADGQGVVRATVVRVAFAR